MSYCVNCGVELAESERLCPLCGTEVVNPRAPWKEPSTRPYPASMDTILRHVDRRYVAELLTAFMAIPVAVCILCDLLASGRFTWSVYVIGAGFMLGVWVVLPLYCKRYHLLTFLTADCVSVLLYLLSIELFTDQQWFLPVGFPLAGSASVFILTLACLFRREKGQLLLVRVALVLCAAGILAIVTEIVLDHRFSGFIHLSWSPYVLTPCLVLAAVTQIIEHQKKLKEEIRKRLFY